ncbi:MAG TPA: hypothetical protein VK932_13755 [Kofleriaceae bacterium]|nr:hypothetical protein [Kofleriaceae bacterium]
MIRRFRALLGGRRLAAPLALAAAAAAAGALFAALVHRQAPREFYDSSAYFEAAAKPWSFDQFLYPKPVLTSIVYRALDADRIAIVNVQAWLAFLSWAAVAAALVAFLRRPAARVAAGLVVALLALHPTRIGYTDALLSESLNDSLLALCLAAALGLLAVRARIDPGPRRARATLALSLALVALVALWLLARDTNAVVALAAILLVATLWARPLGRGRWGAAGLAAAGAGAGFVLWSTSAIPSPTHFSVQAWFPADFTARGTYARMNNVVDRIIPDPEARAFFERRGLPMADRIATLENRHSIIYDPALAPARTWIARESQGVYVRWLLAHPLERASDQVVHAWTLLGIEDPRGYMPDGWIGRSKAARWILGVATSKPVVLLLLVLCPVALWRARRHAGSRLALCLIASGWIGSAAAFYADTAEPGRHCYGSGQQIVFGLFLAALTLLEHGVRAPAAGRPRGSAADELDRAGRIADRGRADREV